MTFKVVRSEDEFRDEAGKHDTDVKFDGRTLIVDTMFHTVVDPYVLSDRVRAAAAGPGLRMVFGTASRRRDGISFRSFVNTDEDELVVYARMRAVDPRPASIRVGVVASTKARELWAEFHRAIDGGD